MKKFILIILLLSTHNNYQFSRENALLVLKYGVDMHACTLMCEKFIKGVGECIEKWLMGDGKALGHLTIMCEEGFYILPYPYVKEMQDKLEPYMRDGSHQFPHHFCQKYKELVEDYVRHIHEIILPLVDPQIREAAEKYCTMVEELPDISEQ